MPQMYLREQTLGAWLAVVTGRSFVGSHDKAGLEVFVTNAFFYLELPKTSNHFQQERSHSWTRNLLTFTCSEVEFRGMSYASPQTPPQCPSRECVSHLPGLHERGKDMCVFVGPAIHAGRCSRNVKIHHDGRQIHFAVVVIFENETKTSWETLQITVAPVCRSLLETELVCESCEGRSPLIISHDLCFDCESKLITPFIFTKPN